MDGKKFKLTKRQEEAQPICAGPAQNIMLEGGSRSGKSVLHCRNLLWRAIKAPGSRHVIFRFRFNHVKRSIWLETMPFVVKHAFPGLKLYPNKSDWYWTLPNDSEIWIGGLDDKDRTEKILGKEYVTIWLNECSEISWDAREKAKTRLAQKVFAEENGEPAGQLKPRFLYDQNPPPKGHWTYKLFHLKVDPESKKPLPDPKNYAAFKMNPRDNAENLAEGYLDTLKNSSARFRKRFWDGEYADENPYALFNDITIDKWRELGERELPEFVRVVVAVDPSGAGDEEEGARRPDAIGIAVVALGSDNHAYVLEDCTVTAGPAIWGKVVTGAYDRHKADLVVGERNFGGDMVRLTIQVARKNTPYKHVTATRGKVVRASPFAALYEKGHVHHVGYFRELEDELVSFSTMGYLGQGSPNRADALIWALAELFPGMTQDETKPSEAPIQSVAPGRGYWGGG
jgi:hypothetical protein